MLQSRTDKMTCALGDVCGCRSCPIQSLCCDVDVILCSWEQFSQCKAGAVSRGIEAPPLWAPPGQTEAVGFLVLWGFWPGCKDGFFPWWCDDVLHTEGSLVSREAGIVRTVTWLQLTSDQFFWVWVWVPHLWWPFGFEPPCSRASWCPLFGVQCRRGSLTAVKWKCDSRTRCWWHCPRLRRANWCSVGSGTRCRSSNEVWSTLF